MGLTEYFVFSGAVIVIIVLIAAFIASLYTAMAFVVPGGYDPSVQMAVLALLVLILLSGGGAASS